MMTDVMMLCDACGKMAKHTCKNCGKRVCNDHFDTVSGWCTSCRSGKKLKK